MGKKAAIIMLLSYISRIRWWAASPSPNCKSTTLSIPSCLECSVVKMRSFWQLLILAFLKKKLDSLISLDVHQALVVDVLSQLHRKSWGCRVLWPLKLCSVQPNRGKIVLNSFHLSCISILMGSPCARLNQKNNLLVWLVKLYQVGLVVHIVHLFLH